MQLYILALIGFLLFTLFDLAALKRSLPELTIVEVIGEYFSVNVLHAVISITLLLVVVYLFNVNSAGEVLNYFGLDATMQLTPGYAVVLGFTINTIAVNLRKITSPILSETTNMGTVKQK